MPVKNGVDFFGESELEHDVPQELYKDKARAQVLEGFNYKRDMVGNLRSLYISLDIAEQLAELPDDHPYKQFLRDTRAGTVADRSGDISVGGFQEGKREFLTKCLIASTIPLLSDCRKQAVPVHHY